MLTKSFFRVLSVYLAVSLVIMSLPSPCWALFIAHTEQTAGAEHGDRAAVQTTLESSLIQQRLADLGLSPGEARARVNAMSDQQVHQLASSLESVQAGADTLEAVVIILLAAILVVGILELTGHSVIIR